MKPVSEKELVDINNKLNRLIETTTEIQCKLNRTSSRVEEIEEKIENNKNTTNAVYKFAKKQDYNSKHSRRMLPAIAVVSLVFLVKYEHYESTWEQAVGFICMVFLFMGYVYYSED